MQITTSVIDWQECIWQSDLPPFSKYLAVYLRSYMNAKQDLAWPSYNRIIQDTKLSRASIAKYLSVLEKAGWIERDSGTHYRSTKYKATFPQEITDALEGSTPHGLGSSPRELGVVREAYCNKQ